MVFEESHGVLGDGQFRKAQPCRDFLDEVFGEQADVFRTLAKGRELDANNVESVKKILTEASFGDFLFEIFVCGRDDADIRPNDLIATDPREFTVLEDAQNFRLELNGHVADFIKEKGTAIALFEPSCALGYRSSERALFVSKKFAFKELFRDGRAVDSDV